MDELNSLTGLPIKKNDGSQELNTITGTIQDVKQDDSITKSEGNARWPSISGQVDGSNEFEKSIPIFISKKDEQIVCGVVYEPDSVDAQGDQASAEEIRNAAFYFMENVKQFKVNHKGKPANVEILESYIAPQDLTIGERKVKKGSWLITTKVNDKRIWEDIKSKKLTGFSMSGYAKVG